MTAMLLILLDIYVGFMRLFHNGPRHYCMVSLAAYPSGFEAYFAISPTKFRFSEVSTCQ